MCMSSRPWTERCDVARLSVSGLEGLISDFESISELPDEIANAMMDAEAAVVAPAIRKEAAELGMYSGYASAVGNDRNTSATNYLPGQERSYSTGELARSLRVGKMKVQKNVRQKYIYFSGKRKRGKNEIRNSEIAFLNEYGTRTINARNFIYVAIHKVEASAVAAAVKIYDEFLKSKNL